MKKTLVYVLRIIIILSLFIPILIPFIYVKDSDESNSYLNIFIPQDTLLKIEEKTNIETRETVLGYIQRGGSPSPKDRLLATRFGSSVADLIAKKKFGCMVALQNDEIVSVSLNSVSGKIKNIPKDYSLIKQAKSMGTCFGDEKVSINKPI